MTASIIDLIRSLALQQVKDITGGALPTDRQITTCATVARILPVAVDNLRTLSERQQSQLYFWLLRDARNPGTRFEQPRRRRRYPTNLQR